jgi:hypothetical protein
MVSSGMLHRVALVRTDVPGEHCASFIRVTGISELGTTQAVTSNRGTLHRLLVTASVVPSSPIVVTLMKEALSSPETSVLTRTTRCNIPEDTTLHSHCCENLKSYMFMFYCRKQIVTAVRNENVLIIAGDTGCGKSTQVPQYLLEAGFKRIGKHIFFR